MKLFWSLILFLILGFLGGYLVGMTFGYQAGTEAILDGMYGVLKGTTINVDVNETEILQGVKDITKDFADYLNKTINNETWRTNDN